MQPDDALVPTRLHGWRTGFGNMAAKEHGVWWRTRRWALHLVLWIVIINGFLVLVNSGSKEPRGPDKFREVFEVFFRVGGLFATIGVITITQSLLVGEKQLGTMAWLLTKPIARPAVLLAKLLESVYTVLFLMLMVPASLLVVHTRLVWGAWPRMPGYVIGLLLLALSHVFYVTFVLMLGTFFQRRGPVSGVAFGFLFAGIVLPNFVPPAVMALMPWPLHPLAAAHAVGDKLPAGEVTTVVATLVWIGASLAVALWRFNREEY